MADITFVNDIALSSKQGTRKRAQSLQSSLTVCDLLDCSPQAALSMGILQARILEWAAISSSRGPS